MPAQMGSPLRLLKEGSNAPPLFITHGIGGLVTELDGIAKFLKYPGPVHGIQWKGLGFQEKPDESIDAMAESFTEAIVSVWPDGPYLLAGWSIGGLSMLEVARRLTTRRRNVALLVLLDSY